MIPCTRESFGDLGFKAKGNAHKLVAKAKPAQVEPAVMASLQEFAQEVCTLTRLDQGVRSINSGVCVFELQKIGDFCRWIAKEIERECAAEIEASNLNWRSC